jgi:hypothetical protein
VLDSHERSIQPNGLATVTMREVRWWPSPIACAASQGEVRPEIALGAGVDQGEIGTKLVPTTTKPAQTR